MSNYYADYEEVTEKKPVKKLEKGIKRLLIIAAVIFAAQLIWLFGISPFVPFSVIEVHGIPGLDRADILSIAGINEESSYISTNTKSVQTILSGHLLVESVVVMKRFPDKLSIFLTPREAAAVLIGNANSGQVPVFIDKRGVIFKAGRVNEKITLPVISGIENPMLNTRLPDALLPLLESINVMASNTPELLSVISEIRIERKAWGGYDLVLFPVHSSIRVRVENNLTEDVLRYMLILLNVLNDSGEKPKEIDFRSGIGSYTVKEMF